MKASIKNFQGGRKTQKTAHIIIEVEGIDSAGKAGAFLGKPVHWRTSSGKTLSGKITGLHGRKGALKAKMSVPLPGQALGSRISIRL